MNPVLPFATQHVRSQSERGTPARSCKWQGGVNPRGQIALPEIFLILIMAAGFVGFLHWGKQMLWQMRLESAADAAALSAARSQAEILNTLSSTENVMNVLIQKVDVPFINKALGEILPSQLNDFLDARKLLKKEIWAFKTFPAGVGGKVSTLNGAQGHATYFPVPMDPYLVARDVTVAIGHVPAHFDEAYYARAWSPGYVHAQPPHKTTWLVRRNGQWAMATARLWLDVKQGTIESNGGFPREHESLLRGIGIQGLYPQFNARLLDKPRLSLEKFLQLVKK